MTAKVTINRLATGVPGLDAILGGGLPEFSFNLIDGAPGCGKTTLAHQMMFAMATVERPALYLTVLGEPPLKMLRYQQQYDFFDERVVGTAVQFINLAEVTLAGDLNQVLKCIVDEVEKVSPAFVFIDSFRSILGSSMHADIDHQALQKFVQDLGMLMTSWQATTFLIGEYFSDIEANPVLTVADGLIWLSQSVQRNSMVRKMHVMKMRGQATVPGLHSFRMNSAGIEIFAPVLGSLSVAATPHEPRLVERMSTGVPDLDEMLGGGLPRGYSILVAGPSGSGKSILTATFLAEGVRNGETGVIAAFEQHPSRGRNRELNACIAAGKVGVVEVIAPDLSIDEIVIALMRETVRLNAKRVVIDSLSGFELSLAPTFRDDFRESILRLVTTLTHSGVTVMLTSELEDRYTDLRFSSYGTAFLTDAIVVQRYIELNSRLRRMIAVVKVRASAHSNQLREYHINDDGIHIDGMLLHQEGLLGGRPTEKNTAQEFVASGVKND